MELLASSLTDIATLLQSGMYRAEDSDVDFEPVYTWERDENGKSHLTDRQSTSPDGILLWHLPLRARVLRYGRPARVDAGVTIAAATHPRMADINIDNSDALKL